MRLTRTYCENPAQGAAGTVPSSPYRGDYAGSSIVKPRAALRIGSLWGVPIYAHVTLPLGLALVSQFSFRPWTWLGLIVIVLVHELGHALLLLRYRLPVLHIVMHGFGGEVETVDWITPWQRAVVAWGGVLAQAALFFVVSLSSQFGLWCFTSGAVDLRVTLTATNLLVAAFNLLPFGNLDGRQAWRLPFLVLLRARHAWLAWRLARARRERLH